MTSVPVLELNNGVRMPQLGYGVFQIPDDETTTAVKAALDAGYRSIDTAAVYGNEKGVGQAIAESGLARDELFVTTKLWNANQGYDTTLKAFDESMAKLGLEQLDLYLIHWPTPQRDKYLDTWKAFEQLYRDGRVRAIGVSNFQPAHLERLMDASDVVPAVNQIELHPYLQQQEVREFDAKHGIATEAWSPLAKGGSLLGDPVVAELAVKHSRTPAQIVLRWHLQLGNVVIPKSVTPSRIAENFDLFGFTLTEEELESLTPLDRGERTGPDPDSFNAA
ncbi:diketogulonate reductase-like aldo/keto reductase [Amycolatopsis lexingtonensis]|uniref:Diketogulonate reductase-like aldo/keto reductase n=1 Tax=Amycolatopsis lexingtonensis TaxID=218822 RepID=A0ABR9IGB3_9PSEU|nr:aldo/keto reductase [Amycolatopsis lexingtonensis]MBE1502236.1 diketogulonate reductase-like aldo/keto reductase [Amycolatopsis lexingtonensis]